MTTSTSPSDWFHQFYNHSNPSTNTTLSGQSSDATVVSTTLTSNTPTNNTTTTDNYSLGQLGLGGPTDSFLSPNTTVASGRSGQETRVARPARKRSRASRKNPTTLLNTDTTNFRAMVQRYTGGGGGGGGGGASMTYSPLESASLGGFHPGQMGNFNQLQGSMAGVDLRASQLHQQLLMQQHGFGSTANMSHVDPRAALQGSDHLYSSSMVDHENKRGGGFMF